MPNRAYKTVVYAMSLATCLGLAARAQLPGVSPRACAEVKYITRLAMNLRGTQMAYLVKSPRVDKNVNEYQLYVKSISDETPSPGNLLMTGIEMSDPQWISGDRKIAVLVSAEYGKSLIEVDVATGVNRSVLPDNPHIRSFSMSATGDTVAYSVQDPTGPEKNFTPSADQLASGYRIDFDAPENKTVKVFDSVDAVYLRHKSSAGTWSAPQRIVLENPFTHARTSRVDRPARLSLSPNGKKLFLTYYTDGIPKSWSENPLVQQAQRNFVSYALPVLFDVATGKTSLALNMIDVSSTPMWSPDSRMFFINSHAPVDSRWEAEDINDQTAMGADLFVVNVETAIIREVLKHTVYDIGPLFLTAEGDLVVQRPGASIERLHAYGTEWQKINDFTVPKDAEDRFFALASNGKEVFGVHETVTAPDALFRYRPGQNSITLLTNLNTDLNVLKLASVRPIEWNTTEGLTVHGLLFVPPNYVEGTRYPLVIQTKPDSGWFSCDYGPAHFPSFAPQPIASAGIMYLARSDYGENFNQQVEIGKRPTGYPGGISEAVQQMDIWDSAVESLSQRGLIDPAKVGIIGFSRTAWQVEFDLVHARTHYAAATATDGVQFNLSEYWLFPWMAGTEDAMYGGPPYGSTRANWEQYSISFNLEKMRTPLLMEQNGYGVQGELINGLPRMLATYLEVLTGLRRLKKPVELYYYPGEIHQTDHPRAREATIQRNVDWYRFWLQGYERHDPQDIDQYKRWERLRMLRDSDAISHRN